MLREILSAAQTDRPSTFEGEVTIDYEDILSADRRAHRRNPRLWRMLNAEPIEVEGDDALFLRSQT
jgi:hypothetical protein